METEKQQKIKNMLKVLIEQKRYFKNEGHFYFWKFDKNDIDTWTESWKALIKGFSVFPRRKLRNFYCIFTEKAIIKLANYEDKENKFKNKIKRREIIEFRKKKKFEYKTERKASLEDCLTLLNKIFTLNKNVKKNAYTHHKTWCHCCWWNGNFYWERCWECCGTGSWTYTEVDYYLRDKEYSKKTKYIKTAIQMISQNRLPIKYGKNDGIVYFEYLGKQVSFHDPKNFIKCKPFNGKWTWKINQKIPFNIKTSKI